MGITLDKIKIFLVIILALVVAMGFLMAGCSSGRPSQGTSGEGSPSVNLAPDFKLSGLDGQFVSLADFQGSPVILNFWAISCPPCRYEMPFLEEVYREWSDKGLVLLAINVGEKPRAVWEFLQNYGYSFPVLLDLDMGVAAEYNILNWGIPVSYFIDKDGVIQYIKISAFLSKAEIISYLDKIISSE